MEGVCSIFLTPKQTCTLKCTNMEADDNLTAVIHQASEGKSQKRNRERKAGGKAEKSALLCSCYDVLAGC